jgi:hypothetical protein
VRDRSRAVHLPAANDQARSPRLERYTLRFKGSDEVLATLREAVVKVRRDAASRAMTSRRNLGRSYLSSPERSNCIDAFCGHDRFQGAAQTPPSHCCVWAAFCRATNAEVTRELVEYAERATGRRRAA